MKKLIAVLVSVLLLGAMIPLGTVSVSAAYDFLFPVNNGGKIAYVYGYSASYGSVFHAGIDIHSSGDDTIYAAAAGTVVATANACPHVSIYPTQCEHYNTYGNYVKIRHSDGTYAIYGHLKQHTIQVAVGDTVYRGQALATMGSSGYSSGKHLHFEVRLSDNKTTVNTNYVSNGGSINYSTSGYGVPSAPSVKLSDPICKPVREETFMLKNAAYPSMYLNVYAGKDANATKVVAWEIDTATKDQQFNMIYLGDGSYYFQAAGLTNRVLDIYWGSNNVVDYGDTLQVWTKGEYDETTIFNVVPVGANKYAIELKSLDNAVLTMTGGQNNSTITLQDYIANDAQHWYFCDLSGVIANPSAGDNHTWDNGVATTPATCSSEGVMTYTCTSCGLVDYHVIPVGEHVYDDDYDAACNVCGDIREVPEKPPVTPDLPADAPAFVVESTTAREGEEFTVAIRTQRNSGIVSFKLNVSYDADLLELVGYEEKDFSSMSFGPETNNPFVINWVDAVRPDNTTNGVVVLLTFRVKEGVPVGNTAITLSYNADDVYDQNFENVGFRVENGTVEIVEYTPGDLNGDGKINNKDLGLLQQYLNGWMVTVSEKGADANGDGKVNNKDLGLLQQYLNGWNVELG